MISPIKMQFDRCRVEYEDLYDCLNHFRSWVNENVVNYEIFLEDNWFDSYTTIEYTFRCLETFNIMVFAEDAYKNSRDEKGIWHLGDYVKTRWTIEEPWQSITSFMAENASPQFKEPSQLSG